MVKIKTLKDSEGNSFYPQTHTKGIVDDNGNNLEAITAALGGKIEEGINLFVISPERYIICRSIDKAVEITFNNEQFIFIDEYLNRFYVDIDKGTSYIVPHFGSLLLDKSSKTIFLSGNYEKQDKRVILLAYVEDGVILNGLLSTYHITKKIDEEKLRAISAESELQPKNMTDAQFINKTINYWVNSSNVETKDPNFDIYDFDLNNATKIAMYVATGGGYAVFVDSENIVVGDAIQTSGEDRYVSKWIELTIPESAVKLRVTQAKQKEKYPNAYPLRVLMDNQQTKSTLAEDSLLNGKKVLFVGDSITYMSYYVNEIQKATGCNVYNRGVSGSTLAVSTQRSDSMCERLDLPTDDSSNKNKGFPSNADFVFIFGGINDWGLLRGQEFGDLNAPIDNTTFCGALKYLYRGLKRRYPNAKFYVLNLLHTYHPSKFVNWRELSYEDDDETKTITVAVNNSGKTLYDYRDAISKAAQMYSIPIIDLFNVGFTATLDSDREKYTEDGLHPNEEGGKIMAEYILKHIHY